MGVDLDRLASGCASISRRSWSGIEVCVRALPALQFAESRRAASSRVDPSLTGKARDFAFAHEHGVEMIALCVYDADGSPLLSRESITQLDAESLVSLRDLVLREQAEAHGMDADVSETMKALESDTHRTLDRAAALHAVGLQAYYGAPACSLTDWQVTIYLHLIRKED